MGKNHPNETLWPSCCRRHLSINCVFTATKNGNLTSALLLPFLVASMGSVTCIPNSFHIFYDSLRKKNHLLTYQMLVLPCLLGSKSKHYLYFWRFPHLPWLSTISSPETISPQDCGALFQAMAPRAPGGNSGDGNGENFWLFLKYVARISSCILLPSFFKQNVV